MTLVSRIVKLAKEKSDKSAVILRNEKVSYRELHDGMQIVAANLVSLGIEKGDHVVFTATSKPECAILYLGIVSIGAVAVFSDKNATADEMARIYSTADARLFISNKGIRGHEGKIRLISAREIMNNDGKAELRDNSGVSSYELFEPEGSDISEIIFTTGSTGTPKGCMLSYEAVDAITQNTINGVGMREDDVVLIPLPLHHSFALRVFRAALYLGATVVLQNGFTFAREVEKNIDQHSVTGITVTSASLETIRKQMQDAFVPIMQKLRYIEGGSSLITIQQRLFLKENLPDTELINTWGSSETGGCIFFKSSQVGIDSKAFSSLGKVPEGIEVAFFDEDMNPVSGDEKNPGRLAFCGKMQMSGYWNNPELNAKTIHDGWLLTGDMCYRGEDGYIYMLGRADDLINFGGEKVAPSEIENAALDIDGVADAACFGTEDPKGIFGEVPILYVCIGPDSLDKNGIRAELGRKLNSNKMPQEIHIISELPRNDIGKKDKKALKKIWEKGSDDTNDEPLYNPVVQAILNRRSIRDFTEKDIPDDILDMILKCGYYAPSGHNMQTWQFTVVRKAEDIKKISTAAKEAASVENVYFYGFNNPKLLILVSNDDRNPCGCQDASCAAENIMLAAHSYGIGSVWLNPLVKLRNVEPVKSVLDEIGIPGNHTVWSMIALGYSVEKADIPRKKENVVKWV